MSYLVPKRELNPLGKWKAQDLFRFQFQDHIYVLKSSCRLPLVFRILKSSYLCLGGNIKVVDNWERKNKTDKGLAAIFNVLYCREATSTPRHSFSPRPYIWHTPITEPKIDRNVKDQGNSPALSSNGPLANRVKHHLGRWQTLGPWLGHQWSILTKTN